MPLEKTHAVTQATLPHRDAALGGRIASLAAVVGFAALTFVGANIFIPLEPIPVTLQTLFVLLAGAFIGRGRGAASQILYVGAGAAGAPVFAGGALGLGILAGPTGGYLLGFAVAPLVVGALIHRTTTLRGQTLAFLAGTLVIFALGVTHLAVIHTGSVTAALRFGFLPFIPGAIIKIVAALSIYRSWTALRRESETS